MFGGNNIDGLCRAVPAENMDRCCAAWLAASKPEVFQLYVPFGAKNAQRVVLLDCDRARHFGNNAIWEMQNSRCIFIDPGRANVASSATLSGLRTPEGS